MGLFGGDTIVGLDIGTSSIKAVKMQVGRNGWDVVAAAQVATPRGAIAEGMVTDEKALLPAVKHLFARTGVRGSDVIAAVNFTSAVLVRRAGLPVLTPDALRKQIRTQPDQFGLSPGAEYVHDFEILGTQGEGDEKQMDTVLVSAPRAAIEGRLRTLEGAGLDVMAVDIEPFALMRSLVESNPALAGLPGAVAILDLGAVHTDVTVVRGSSYIFTRAIPLGGDPFTSVVQQALQCSIDEAEAAKARVDLSWLLQAPDETADAIAYQATTAVKSVLDDLLREVRNSILFYQSQLPDDDVEDGMVGMILLAGGTALMKGLPEYMQAAFSLQVERADFSQGFPYRVTMRDGDLGPEQAPLFALAMGLAAKEPMERARQAAARGREKRQKRGKEPAPDPGLPAAEDAADASPVPAEAPDSEAGK